MKEKIKTSAKYVVFLSGIAFLIEHLFALVGTQTACVWIFYQPKVPKALRKE